MEQKFAFAVPSLFNLVEDGDDTGDSYFEMNSEAEINDSEEMAPMRRSLSTSDIPSIVEHKPNIQNTAMTLSTILEKSLSHSHLKPQRPRQTFVSMAEGVRNFQFNIPERFHSTACGSKNKALRMTQAHSPALFSKYRTRKVHDYLPPEEREKLEIEQMKAYQIKAKPVNPRVLAGPSNMKTFNKNMSQSTKPIIKPKPSKAGDTKSNLKKTAPKGGTKIQPFSFESRDKELFRKKEEKIKQYLEYEKKMRIFHARKVPEYIQATSGGSIKSSESKENLKTSTPYFRAKPAKVLYQPPFQVKYDDKILTQIENLQLETEARASKRAEFEAKIKEKEELKQKTLKELEARRLLMEEQEKLKIRQETHIKAQPIRKYKPINPAVSLPLTIPVTPSCAKARSD